MSLFPRWASSDFSPVFRLVDEYDRAARELTHGALKGMGGFQPRFDVKETKEAYELHGELPGVEQKDVNIEWQGPETLSISGRTEHRSESGTPPKGFVEGEQKSHQPTVEDEAEAESSKKPETEVATTGPKEVQKKPEEGRYWITERSVGEYHRSFSFPAPVDHDNVKASLKNGVLNIIVPKAQRVTPKKITIE
jgi:HSP20 family molecular chaperone IbpA